MTLTSIPCRARQDRGRAERPSHIRTGGFPDTAPTSLTLHGPDGERLVGFDNAHPAANQKRGAPRDHRHRLRTVKAYDYRDAASLLADFWDTVDTVLREKGVIP